MSKFKSQTVKMSPTAFRFGQGLAIAMDAKGRKYSAHVFRQSRDAQINAKPQDLQAGKEFYQRLMGGANPEQRDRTRYKKDIQDMVDSLMDDYTIQFDEDEDGIVKDVRLVRRAKDKQPVARKR